jgi:hypothetical protein
LRGDGGFFIEEKQNAEQVLLTRLEFLPPFFRTKKLKPRSYRTYSRRFRKEKRRFGNYHEVLLYFLLFVVENKKFSYFFDRRKNGFYNSTNKKHPVEGAKGNIPRICPWRVLL